MIFVFGSNEAGVHGAGAALTARIQHGAKIGQAYGYSGNSFAIPTKDTSIRYSLPLNKIEKYVNQFLIEAGSNIAIDRYQVTRIGCGLASLKDEDIAPMFKHAPDNCLFDEKWKPFLGDKHKYWGTY